MDCLIEEIIPSYFQMKGEFSNIMEKSPDLGNAIVSILSTVQVKELGVLKEIIKVLESNHLHYCAIGGTCLGAVRHKGFIPWDDDIDIALPRSEYELFRTELYKQLPEHIRKVDCDVSISHDFLFTKIHDSMTTQIEQYAIHSPDRITGAFVDVYPLDGRPDNLWSRRLWYLQYIFLMTSNGRRRAYKEKIDSLRSLIKEVYGAVLKKLVRYNYFTDKLQALLSKYDITQYKTAIWNGAGRRDAKRFDYDMSFPCEWFTDTIPMQFEDMTIQIPRCYHDYLTTQFGDYMQLPPENERGNWHHVVVSDMDTPCAYYMNLIKDGTIDSVVKDQ